MSWTRRDVLALGSLALPAPRSDRPASPRRHPSAGERSHPRLGPAAVRPDAHHRLPRARAAELDA
jgi:hypothetical protein